jgi:hypothetical protein
MDDITRCIDALTELHLQNSSRILEAWDEDDMKKYRALQYQANGISACILELKALRGDQ